MLVCLLAICSITAVVLSGCGGTPTATESPPAPAPAPEPSPIPSISVPHCDDGTGLAAPYYVSDTLETLEPMEPAETTLCWNDAGIVVFTNQTELELQPSCETCGCAVWEGGDVAEIMMGPVTSLDKAPNWYLEMNVGAVHDAFWGGTVVNLDGDDHVYVGTGCCTAVPRWGDPHFNSCGMNCSDSAALPTYTTQSGSGWWSRRMEVPWTMYAESFRPNGGQPHQYWRGNFYRFSYPYKNDNGQGYNNSRPQLSGWVPTHDPSFHRPKRFGKITMVAKKTAIDFRI